MCHLLSHSNTRGSERQGSEREEALVREPRRLECLPRSSQQLGALSLARPGAPCRALPGANRKPGKCFPRSRVPTTPRHPPTRAPVPSAPPPPAARPVPEAETDPNPAPLSSTAPGRASRVGVEGSTGAALGSARLCFPPRAAAGHPGCGPAGGVGLSWRDRAEETSGRCDRGHRFCRSCPLCSRNHCVKCNTTLSRALEAFCDLQSPATVALQGPSFLGREFPYVLLRAHSWKCFRVANWN
ncbi:uncharacterized protein LOC118239515 [Cricetulus griseus]|uniref:Uncharacterized protein LOC118239515 n=1 Tax=Cricetulus griseus TaxID=10029 RepID=A0A9J7H7T0_CRIGR|nr:uncharacterized protein LOC118239515 [Cricetulus griseus]